MSDINFNINSNDICVGGAYKINEKMKVNVGYMHSFYENHEIASQYGKDIYTRKNDAIGASLDIRF